MPVMISFQFTDPVFHVRVRTQYQNKKGSVLRIMKIISTDKAPAAIGPYSQAYCVNGLLFTSGQIALNPATGEIVGTDIEAQAEQCCKNVGAILEAAGTDFSKVVKTTCFLADMKDFAAFNAVYAELFPGKPARSCVEASKLPKGALVEIEAVAELDK